MGSGARNNQASAHRSRARMGRRWTSGNGRRSAMAHGFDAEPMTMQRGRRGRGIKVSGKPETLSVGHWQNIVSQARAVGAYSPELAFTVRDGSRTLKSAFDEVRLAWTKTEDAAKDRVDQSPGFPSPTWSVRAHLVAGTLAN